MVKNDQAKLVAIVSYLFWVGWIVALILNMNNKTKLGSFHIRQALLLWLISVLSWIVRPIAWIIGIIVIVFWIMGLISAINGQEKKLPLIGDWAQNWFKGL